MNSEQEQRADEATTVTMDVATSSDSNAPTDSLAPSDADKVAGADNATPAIAAPPTTDAVATTPMTDLTTTTAAVSGDDESPTPPDTPHIGDSLEAIKTAVVWLVVVEILTVLSPLLNLSLKWALIVGLMLPLASFLIAGVAYLKARRIQKATHP